MRKPRRREPISAGASRSSGCRTRLRRLQRIAEAARAGAAVAWVRNTVDDAFDAVGLLRERGFEVALFHARFAMGDRLEVERAIVAPLRQAGRSGAAPGGAGRDPGDRAVARPRFRPVGLRPRADRSASAARRAALAPSRAAAADPWPTPARRLARSGGKDRAGLVRRRLPRAPPGSTRTTPCFGCRPCALFGRERVRVPEDVRALVEAVYGHEADGEDWAPAALERNVASRPRARRQRPGRLGADQPAFGEQGLRAGDHPGWDEDTRTPTRARRGDDHVAPRPRQRDRLSPWCSGSRRAPRLGAFRGRGAQAAGCRTCPHRPRASPL